MNRSVLKRLVEDSSTPQGRAFELAINAVIFVWLISFSVDSLPDLAPKTRNMLWWVEVVVVGLFTVEYLLRLYVADRKLKFVFSFWGLIDLLAILPFYLSLTVDLRSLRAFRLLRLLRILKLGRTNQAVKRLYRAWLLSKEEFFMFLFASVVLLFIAAAGIHHFEHEAQPEKFASIFHSLWWAVATLTTVGYGDVYPVTVGGRIFTFVILMIGLGIVAVPTGLMTSALTQARELESEEKETK